MDEAKAIGQQYIDLIDATSKSSESHDALQATAESATKSSDWIGSHLPATISNACPSGRNYVSFNDLFVHGQW
jgi:hypothetical protein